MNYNKEYKEEVGSLTLSDEFKESLKQKCLEELGKKDPGAEAAPSPVDRSTADIYSKIRVYKYVSMAACFLAVISTIGVFSMMGSQFKTKSSENAADSYSDSVDFDVDEPIEPDPQEPGNPTFMQEGLIGNNNGITENVDSAESDDVMVADVDDEEIIPETEPVDEQPAEAAEDEYEDDSFDESLLAKLSDYTGEYVTTDYVLGLQNSTENEVSNIYSDIKAMSNDSGESEPIEEPSYRKSLNFYDVLSGALGKESELLGATLVKCTIEGVRSERGVYTEYDVRINYDYMDQTSCSVPARIWVKGNSEHQIEGMPMYSDGDVIITSLMANPDGSVSVVDELLYDVYDLSGTDIAYHRVYSNVNPGFTDMGVLSTEREFITTAANNPVKYVHKSSTRELTRYIRRKIVGENYNIADLEMLGLISRGDAEFEIPERTPDEPDTPDIPDAADDTPDIPGIPDNPEVNPETPVQNEDQPQIDKLRVNSGDDSLVITSAGNVILLHDPQTSSYLSSKFKNSASGTTSSAEKSNVMFVGGKLIFNSSNAFGGELIGIEISGAGCPLDIGFCGVKVGDSLELVKQTLGITKNLAPNSKVTYQGETITAVLTFRYDALSKIEIN